MAIGLQRGRSDSGGPAVAGFNILSFDRFARAASAQTDEVQTTFTIPFPCRVQEIIFSNVSTSGGSGRPSFQLLNVTQSEDLIASDPDLVSNDSVHITPTSTPALQNRDLAKGDEIDLQLTAVASEVSVALRCELVVFPTGQVVAAASRPDEQAND